jgi:hypothetical protein
LKTPVMEGNVSFYVGIDVPGGGATLGVPNFGSVTIIDLFNNPPTAEAGGPYSVAEGASVVLDGSGSVEPDRTTLGDYLTYD